MITTEYKIKKLIEFKRKYPKVFFPIDINKIDSQILLFVNENDDYFDDNLKDRIMDEFKKIQNFYVALREKNLKTL